MQVNLSFNTSVLKRTGLAEGLRAATTKATASTGIQLLSPFPDHTPEVELEAAIDSLAGLAWGDGPEQTTAAAALATLAIEGYVMLPASACRSAKRRVKLKLTG